MAALPGHRQTNWRSDREPRRGPLRLVLIVAATGSCSTMSEHLAQAPTTATELSAAQVTMEIPDVAAPPALVGEQAVAANAALPVAFDKGPAASPLAIFAAATPVARLRAEDCLAQAIYYEARSEPEDGQRAVAQVVLNRVRHPAWPNTVCGVVYQGAMRPGGGCQFTFTCDGSLRFAAYGEGWVRARRLAAEALAGRVFAPVGLSTFYHANYVMPAWAPRLLKTAVIGAHLFYRLPGSAGLPGAFSSAYAGVEPIARPNPIMTGVARIAAVAGVPGFDGPGAVQMPSRSPQLVQEQAETARAEDLQVRPEYRNSGQWRDDAPASLSGH